MSANSYRIGDAVLWTANTPNPFSQNVKALGTVTGVQVNPPGILANAFPPVTVYYVTLADGRHVTAGISQLTTY